MGSPLPRQGPHDLTVGKKVKTIFTLFIFTCTQYWIISFHASEGPPIQNEQMWAASCSQKMKPSLKLVVSSHHNGVWIFFHLSAGGWIVFHLCTGRLDATLGSIVLGVSQSRLCVEQRSAGHSEKKMNLIICFFASKQAISLAFQWCLTSRSIL